MKKKFTLSISLILIILISSCKSTGDKITMISAPAGDNPVQINKDGKTIIPNGRIITPFGRTIMTAPHPYGLIVSPDGNTAVTANSGVGPLSISIIRNLQGDRPEVQQVPPGADTDKGILAAKWILLTAQRMKMARSSLMVI